MALSKEARVKKLPNIVFVITDQQRFDTIAATGAPWMHTPNLDRLVKEGVSFNNCFVNSPVCVSSRASLFTGKYPHQSGTFSNFHPWEPTWVRWLADIGYHCVNIGKMHINPYQAMGGFHQRFVVENKDRPLFLDEHSRAFYDEWDKILKVHNVIKPSRYTRFAEDPEGYKKALGAFVWDADEELHSDFFVGNNANWWLKERISEAPLFLQIGFPGPHPPYDPSQRFLDIYKDVDIPVPSVTESEIQKQPKAQKVLRDNMMEFNFDSVNWQFMPAKEDLLRVRRHYAANITMIDEKVGEIINTLESRGDIDNTIVIFTSDHADALGDHGHIQKWTMFDAVLRVPLIFWSPGKFPIPRSIEDSIELFDVAATVLDICGIEKPRDWDGNSLLPLLNGEVDKVSDDVVYAELARDHIQTEAELIIMRRDSEKKVVWYLNSEEGEFYDLKNDPDEVNNLWFESDYKKERDLIIDEIRNRTMSGMLASRQIPTPKPQVAMPID